MYAQLVAATGDRRETNAGLVVRLVSFEHLKARRRWLADRVIDDLSWSIRPVADEWQIDAAVVRLDDARHHGDVIFFDQSLFEGAIERALRVQVSREHHQPGSFHIEAMHD